jgi:hypothetical protein
MVQHRRDQVVDEGAAARLHRFEQLLAHQHVADAGLGVGVDYEHLLAVIVGQRLGERQHQGGLADPALGVHDGYGVAHARAPSSWSPARPAPQLAG